MASAPMILAFIAVFLGILGVNFALVDLEERRRNLYRNKLEEEIRAEQRERARMGLGHIATPTVRDDMEGQLVMESGTWRERLVWFIEQSGLRTTPLQLAILSLLIASTVLVGGGVILHRWLPAVVLAPFAAVIPWLYVARRKKLRLAKLQTQLPDVFDMMSRILRSGQTISQALQAVADEFPRPASEEFGYCYEQQNLGLSPAVALRELARRTGLLELKIFVLAVGVHRQTGGNLAELLDKLSAIIRDRSRIQGMIKSLTAEGRFQAIILLVLPPFLLAAITFINHAYAMVLFQYPTLLAGMAAFMLFGAAWMYRIVHFDF